ncbi:Afadin and alpha-actinin-binding-domain-containing protein [Kickxella alabastrina]|uniref:Afadin and alpha-actinin-binding-domain-containing protein n=1 Tax=Kickxella alabastrina TaxID=61397 RepID=UPI00222073DA|nr:Afadin and alpha-actinin-binding-domain-containing protein [Kickxella alabastrina]KAI7831015.1 Afadin and alpha-actinin-binding-domain-containing protein [Kickxella alabastrina]
MRHINQELLHLQFPGPLRLAEATEYLEDNQRVVDCLLALLEQRRKDIGVRDMMDEEMRRGMGEEEQLRVVVARLKRELEAKEREAFGAGRMAVEAGRAAEEAEVRRKKCAAELKTVRAGATSGRAQFLHEARKREMECAKLKDRVQRMIADKMRSAKASVEIINPTGAVDIVGAGAAGGRDQAMFRQVVADYEAREAGLVACTEALQGMLAVVVKGLAPLMRDCGLGEGAAALVAEFDREVPPAGVDAVVEALEAVRRHVAELRHTPPAPTPIVIAAVPPVPPKEPKEPLAPMAPMAGVDLAALRSRDETILRLQRNISELVGQANYQKAVLEEQRQCMERLTAERIENNAQAAAVRMLDESFSGLSAANEYSVLDLAGDADVAEGADMTLSTPEILGQMGQLRGAEPLGHRRSRSNAAARPGWAAHARGRLVRHGRPAAAAAWERGGGRRHGVSDEADTGQHSSNSSSSSKHPAPPLRQHRAPTQAQAQATALQRLRLRLPIRNSCRRGLP